MESNIRTLLSTANKSRNNAQVAETLDKISSLLSTEEAIDECYNSGGVATAFNTLAKPHRGVQISALRLLVALVNLKDVKKQLEKPNK